MLLIYFLLVLLLFCISLILYFKFFKFLENDIDKSESELLCLILLKTPNLKKLNLDSKNNLIYYGNHLYHHDVPILMSENELLDSFHKNKKELKSFHQEIKQYFDKSISIVEFFPFNNKDIFGFQTVSRYYWWVSKKKIDPEEFNMENIIHSIKCISDYEEMSKDMRQKMATFWQ